LIKEFFPVERVISKIYSIRKKKVMMDRVILQNSIKLKPPN